MGRSTIPSSGLLYVIRAGLYGPPCSSGILPSDKQRSSARSVGLLNDDRSSCGRLSSWTCSSSNSLPVIFLKNFFILSSESEFDLETVVVENSLCGGVARCCCCCCCSSCEELWLKLELFGSCENFRSEGIARSDCCSCAELRPKSGLVGVF